MNAIRREYEATGAKVVEVSKPMEILPGVWLTGPVPRVHPERNWSRSARCARPRATSRTPCPRT